MNSAMAGSGIVVNCGKVAEPKIMYATRNLIASCKKHKVDRRVHLSSVAVYGESPAQASVSEQAAPAAEKGGYGHYKAKQDAMIQAACAKGELRASVLCIPNVSGIYSPYLMFILELIESGKFALLDDGQQPAMLCDVQNVAQAIVLAFTTEHLDGSRTFIMDHEPTTWKDVVDQLLPLAADVDSVAFVPAENARQFLASAPPFMRSAIGTAKKIVAVPEVKQLVKQNITLTRSFVRWRARFSHLPKGPRTKLVSLFKGSANSSRNETDTDLSQLDPRGIRHQLRGVRHSTEKARQTLGYEPEISFLDSMRAFRKWYRAAHGLNGGCAHLIAMLDQQKRTVL